MRRNKHDLSVVFPITNLQVTKTPENGLRSDSLTTVMMTFSCLRSVI